MKALMRLIYLLLCLCGLVPQSVMATGPRVTPMLFDSDAYEIYALDFPPFISTELENSGPIPEILISALSSPEHNIFVNTQPLQRMVKYYLLEENAVAAVGRHLQLTEDDLKSLVLVPVLAASESYYYFRPNHGKQIAWDGSIGSLAAYRYGSHLGEDASAMRSAGVEMVQGRSVPLIKKLRKGDVDFVRIPDLAADWLFQRYFKGNEHGFERLGPAEKGSVVHAVFNKANPQGAVLAERLRTALEQMLSDGRYEGILAKHLGKKDLVQAHKRALQKLIEAQP